MPVKNAILDAELVSLDVSPWVRCRSSVATSAAPCHPCFSPSHVSRIARSLAPIPPNAIPIPSEAEAYATQPRAANVAPRCVIRSLTFVPVTKGVAVATKQPNRLRLRATVASSFSDSNSITSTDPPMRWRCARRRSVCMFYELRIAEGGAACSRASSCSHASITERCSVAIFPNSTPMPQIPRVLPGCS